MEEVYKVKLVPTNCIGDKAYSDKTKEYIELKDGEILAKRTDIDYLFKNFKVESVEYLGNLFIKKETRRINNMEEKSKCPFLEEYNGDGIEDTDGFDYYSCRILNDEDLKKYGRYDPLSRECYVDNFKECEIYKKNKKAR